MIFMGVQKFGAENIIFSTIAERSGITLFEPAVRMLTGVLEFFAAALLIFPRLSGIGALLSTALIGGAILFHLSPWLGIMVSLEPGTPATPQLFTMAVGSLVLTCVVLFMNRQSISRLGRKTS